MAIHVEREHLEAAIRGIALQTGREVPQHLSAVSYQGLVLRYAALIDNNDCIPFMDNELESLYHGLNYTTNHQSKNIVCL